MATAVKDTIEELSSDTDDEDYVPSDEHEQSEDVSADEEETNQRESDGDDSPETPANRKRKRKKIRTKNRKRLATERGELNVCSEKEAFCQTEEQKDEEVKRKADDLWSSFLQDVGSSQKNVKTSKQVHSKLGIPPSSSKPVKKPQVTVTKVFDFAGEEIRVSKTVDADSKEAKSQEKRNAECDGPKAQQDSTVVTSSCSTSQPGKPAGLSSVLGFINKKNKMSTLDKSKLDWDSFKKEQSLEEELSLHNKSKNSFLERKAFLERTDLREFEIEKSIRQSQTNKR